MDFYINLHVHHERGRVKDDDDDDNDHDDDVDDDNDDEDHHNNDDDEDDDEHEDDDDNIDYDDQDHDDNDDAENDGRITNARNFQNSPTKPRCIRYIRCFRSISAQVSLSCFIFFKQLHYLS